MRRRKITDHGTCDAAGTHTGRGLHVGGWGAVADWRWGRKGGRDRRLSQGLGLPHTARQPAQDPDVLPKQQHPGADSCWGCYPLRKSSGRVSNTRRGLWEGGGLGHFLGTSPFCSRPRSHSTPEQPHLRNQVTTRRKSMLPSWTPVKGVCSMTRGLIQPTARGATKKDQPPLSTSGHKHTHSFRSRLL